MLIIVMSIRNRLWTNLYVVISMHLKLKKCKGKGAGFISLKLINSHDFLISSQKRPCYEISHQLTLSVHKDFELSKRFHLPLRS